MSHFSIAHRKTAFWACAKASIAQRFSALKGCRRMRVSMVTVFFFLACTLGTVPSATIALGTQCAAAQAGSKVQEAAPAYWQMYYNFAPPTDAFIAALAEAQSLPYTQGKEGEARFYADDGRPIYPSNDGAVGCILTVALPAGEVLTRYGAPTGRYVSPAMTTFEQRALPRTTMESDFHIYIVQREIAGVEKGVIAPWFGRTGGGIQYKLPDRISALMGAEPPMLRESKMPVRILGVPQMQEDADADQRPAADSRAA